MTLDEFWWLADRKYVEQQARTPGPGGFSQAEWAKARAAHKAKIKAKGSD